MKYPFTSNDAGIYKMCIINTSTYVVEFIFSLKTGIDAKDDKDLISKNDLKPVEIEGQRLVETVKDLHRLMQMTPGIRKQVDNNTIDVTNFFIKRRSNWPRSLCLVSSCWKIQIYFNCIWVSINRCNVSIFIVLLLISKILLFEKEKRIIIDFKNIIQLWNIDFFFAFDKMDCIFFWSWRWFFMWKSWIFISRKFMYTSWRKWRNIKRICKLFYSIYWNLLINIESYTL